MLEYLLERINQREFESFAEDIKRAIQEHRDWMHKINYAIVTKEPLNTFEFIGCDAHKHCQFGRWLHDLLKEEVFNQGSFLRIEKLHEDLHSSATQLMNQLAESGAIDESLYSHFQKVQKDLFDLMLVLLEFTVVNRNQFDPTTKLMNRRSVDSILAHEKHRMERSERANCCLALADLDNFKAFNDTYGHDVGDKVLEHAASTFNQVVRRHDSVARFGGEEFLFVLPDMSLEEATKTIERVRQHLAKSTVEHNGQQLSVTASFGVTQLCKICDIKESIKNADIALYRAKSLGRNCTVYVDLNTLVKKFTKDMVMRSLNEDQIREHSVKV